MLCRSPARVLNIKNLKFLSSYAHFRGEYTKQKLNFRDFQRLNESEIYPILSSISDTDYSHVIPDVGEVPDLSMHSNKLSKFWHESEMKIQFPGSNKNEHDVFVMDILRALPMADNLRILKKKHVESDEFGGDLDIAICALSYSMFPVFVISESDKSFEEARIKLYAQLKVCHELARDEENFWHPIYGAMTTANKWIVTHFDGKQWAETPIMFINNSSDKTALQTLLGQLYRILKHQSQLAEPISETFKEQLVSDFE
jgi:hypothetical protein